MKLLRVFCLYCLSLGLLCSVSAKPLTTEKIIFTSSRDGNWEIYMMNPDGSQQERLTHHRSRDLYPVLSPTGEEILFVSDRGGEHDLYIMRADGLAERPVFPAAPAIRYYPAWSPDGKKIAYSQLDRDTKFFNIYTARADGTSASRFVEMGNADGEYPIWSPDGTEIAYVVGREIHWASRQIRFINLKTRKQETLLPDDTPRMRNPAWSSVHNKIAFVWYRPEHNHTSIFTVNRNGKGLQQIVDVQALRPAWSPSGDELLYSQLVGKNDQIFKINLVTRGITQLTHDGSNYAGNWFDPSALPISPQPQLLTTTWAEVKSQD